MTTSILIVDDQPMVRAGLTMLLNAETDMDVIGEATSGAEALQLARQLHPDIVLMDVRMPVMDGIAATEELLKHDDELKVIAQLVLKSLQKNITVDWARRETVRARLRVIIKDILEDHGYPPDLSKEAVHNVLLQAEQLSSRWAT